MGKTILATIMFLPAHVMSQPGPTPLLAEDVQLIVVSLSAQGNVIGSGYLQNTGKWIYIVTAKHVVQPHMGGSIDVSLWTRGGRQKPNLYRINLPSAQLDRSIFFSKHDAALLRLGRFHGDGNGIFPGNVKPIDAGGTILAPALDVLISMADVQPTEDVVLVGYPSSLNNYLDEKTRFYDETVPLFRRGIIAGKNKERDLILVDTTALPGNSGGPVFLRRTDRFSWQLHILGIATDYIPSISMSKNERGLITNINFQNAAYTVVLPGNKIKEFLLKTDTLGD